MFGILFSAPNCVVPKGSGKSVLPDFAFLPTSHIPHIMQFEHSPLIAAWLGAYSFVPVNMHAFLWNRMPSRSACSFLSAIVLTRV